MKRLLFLGIILIFAASCSQGGGQKGDYVAKIDGTAITKDDAEYEMKHLPEAARPFFSGPDGTGRFVDELVKKELLYKEALKKGLDKDKDLEKKMLDFKKITLINKLLEKEIEASLKLTDKDLKEYYDKNINDFLYSTQVRISQIVLNDEPTAKKAYDRLNSGEDFSKVAASMSQDKKSSKSGGDLGVFKRGELTRELDNVAFKLKKGEVGPPIAMKDGIHLIKVTDTKGSPVEFEKVKDLINRKLTVERQRDMFDKFMDSLKKVHKVELNKEAISKINTPASGHANKTDIPKAEGKLDSKNTEKKNGDAKK